MSVSALVVTEAILSARSDAIVAADRDGIIRLWNPGAERVRGYSQTRPWANPSTSSFRNVYGSRTRAGYERVMQTGQSRYGESDVLAVPALRKEGTTISVEFTIATA